MYNIYARVNLSIYLSIQDSPREECSLEPQTICNFVTKMVPRYRVFWKSCAFSRIFFAILRPLARTSTGLPLVVQEYTANTQHCDLLRG